MARLTVWPGCCQRRRSGQACARTHCPISVMRPDCSASGTSVVGDTRPRDGWTQRKSASTPATRPSAVATIGWYSVRSSPQVAFEAGPLVVSVLLAQIDDLVTGAALAFRLVHRGVRFSEQIVRDL